MPSTSLIEEIQLQLISEKELVIYSIEDLNRHYQKFFLSKSSAEKYFDDLKKKEAKAAAEYFERNLSGSKYWENLATQNNMTAIECYIQYATKNAFLYSIVKKVIEL